MVGSFVEKLSLICVLVFSCQSGHQDILAIVNRTQWGARPPKGVTDMPNPVSYVIIHHSYIPGACNTTEICIKYVQAIQRHDQDNLGWDDIGYSFAVGGDGNIYEGRGWSAVGAHARGYNSRSIGICVIGDWKGNLPPEIQLSSVKKLMKYGVEHHKIEPTYILYGHRQVSNTECPGDTLFREISSWKHFKP